MTFFLAHKKKDPTCNENARKERQEFIDSSRPLKKQRRNEEVSLYPYDLSFHFHGSVFIPTFKSIKNGYKV